MVSSSPARYSIDLKKPSFARCRHRPIGRADAPAAGPVHNIVFIGDSITMGAGVPNRDEQAAPVIAAHDSPQALGGGATASTSPTKGRTATPRPTSCPPAATSPAWRRPRSKLKAASQGPAGFLRGCWARTTARIMGPTGAPLPADGYAKNLHAIVDKLLAEFPDAKFVLNHPIWYSPNTHNGADYEGSLRRRPAQELLRRDRHASSPMTQASHPGHVFTRRLPSLSHSSSNFADTASQLVRDRAKRHVVHGPKSPPARRGLRSAQPAHTASHVRGVRF